MSVVAVSHSPLLVVEDDQDIRHALALVLESEGYRVVGVANGQEGLDHLRRGERPCVILLDLMMPVMDGWEFRAQQTGDPSLAPIPVIVISADSKVPQKAAALGAAAYLKKPIDFDALIEAVRRYCPGNP